MAKAMISKERIRHDERGDQWFASRGHRVLRFTNGDVMKNLEGVVISILQAAEQAVPSSLTLPRKGGGNGESCAVGEVNTLCAVDDAGPQHAIDEGSM
jgi:hypothetical protein